MRLDTFTGGMKFATQISPLLNFNYRYRKDGALFHRLKLNYTFAFCTEYYMERVIFWHSCFLQILAQYSALKFLYIIFPTIFSDRQSPVTLMPWLRLLANFVSVPFPKRNKLRNFQQIIAQPRQVAEDMLAAAASLRCPHQAQQLPIQVPGLVLWPQTFTEERSSPSTRESLCSTTLLW